MTYLRFIVLTVLAVVFSVCALAADVTGKWTASFDTQVGQQSYTYDLKVSGSQLTGRAKSENGESELQDGKVNGDTITFVENLNFQGMPLRIVYTGKVVSDNEIKFTRIVAEMFTEELVAKRAK
jgi:opacity protein-like surface antigen